MNAQFKKGVLELCVLVLLEKQDLYGYEVIKRITEKIDISEGSIYPILRRLLKQDLCTSYLQESSEGPSRKYYRLTNNGKKHLKDLKEEYNTFKHGVESLMKEEI
ncbi:MULTISPECIES: PadR family transcriptional regulator [Oceanobacillus]|uniref:PadR family transcriptional regulator n=1 Tax=Oceanobacillus kimchii TaxID=746691 RepID=A0ABQ5TFY6_9BACI|nr:MULTISPECIES: PadR family transcriptional regulator [Oceanobacillus]MBT2652739.1 helix-turn-helix transcriptional regulator [Oceanobacillus sp. ISL-73]MCT1577282.1 PadR family transcriptional regulator [Oceanobacillus kimchii]MCT2136888.1 PadR family transcriptional regulator [Oceanobacillus kimchii]OEH53506.1 PadR family transcriptional regulator [Oceanobacillus sp. E9]GLO64987.1 PadR family transcriptional regulator [Oceanobacillus kimchii]